VLYLERKRIEERDAAEAAGVDLWTEELDDSVRRRLLALLAGACSQSPTAENLTRRRAGQVIQARVGLVIPDFTKAFLTGDVDT
jgi:hypothetical protein